MKKHLWLVILALMTSCNGNKKQVVFLGDSITQNAVINSEEFKGFITLMQSEVDENIKLIGKGISGDKVSDLLARYKKDVLELNPDIVFIYIGINDVWHKYDFGTGSDIDLYEKGLRTIIADVKNQGAKVILCTPTVIGENSGEFRLGNKFKDVETMEKMDEDLPGYAWDLLPYKEKPLDLYRSPMWHAEYNFNQRSPYAAIQTSLGCQFKCDPPKYLAGVTSLNRAQYTGLLDICLK